MERERPVRPGIQFSTSANGLATTISAKRPRKPAQPSAMTGALDRIVMKVLKWSGAEPPLPHRPAEMTITVKNNKVKMP